MNNLKTNHYSFRGINFHIPLAEMPAAIRESLELHDRLLDDLVAAAMRHAELLQAAGVKPLANGHEKAFSTRSGQVLAPGRNGGTGDEQGKAASRANKG